MSEGIYLGELEQMILVAILQLEDDAYGPNISRELITRAGRKVTPGALYATIDRLEGKGALTSRYADPAPDRGGKRRRYLTVTPAGIEALQKVRSAWERLVEGLEGVLKTP